MTHRLAESELDNIAERVEWRSPESRLHWRERRVARMIKDGTFRGFGPLVHVVESDGLVSWRTTRGTNQDTG